MKPRWLILFCWFVILGLTAVFIWRLLPNVFGPLQNYWDYWVLFSFLSVGIFSPLAYLILFFVESPERRLDGVLSGPPPNSWLKLCLILLLFLMPFTTSLIFSSIFIYTQGGLDDVWVMTNSVIMAFCFAVGDLMAWKVLQKKSDPVANELAREHWTAFTCMDGPFLLSFVMLMIVYWRASDKKGYAPFLGGATALQVLVQNTAYAMTKSFVPKYPSSSCVTPSRSGRDAGTRQE
jgi:hypothetical protein